jgi:CIC family chloride channel protein
MLLVGCGAAGAIAGIFKAPIAGMVFVVEVLMLDLTMTSVLPLLITSVTAATVSYIFTGTQAMFQFSQTEPFVIERIPYVLLLGVFCGLVSLYFTKVMNWVEGSYRKLNDYWKKFLVGGIMLSVLIFVFPPLYGEGYDTITTLLDGHSGNIMDKSIFYELNDSYWGILVFLFLILLFKVYASSATNAGGGCGGIFAPSLFLGCIAGFIFAHASNYFPFTMYLSEKNFALLGMAGIMSGVMHAPLTGVFLIAELTGGYDLFLPLMIVSISSYITIKMFLPHSIYSMRLAQKGELLTHHKDRAVLTLLNTDHILERDFMTVSPEMSLGDMVKVIAKSGRNTFPVVDEKGVLLGLVLLDNIRNIMFRPELYDRFHVYKFMVTAPAKIQEGTSMEQIMRIFDDTKAWNLPVVDCDGRYIGFMSKSKIFNSYREVLVENYSED